MSLDRPDRVLVTGGSGFVGRHVVRELLARGHTPVCLARDPEKMLAAVPEAASRITIVRGDLDDDAALAKAAAQSQAVIHLVGIILDSSPLARLCCGSARRRTFRHVHVEGTRRVIAAATQAGIRRFVHMSALGTRADAISEYHRTKWDAEELLRNSGLAWTIFRPSIIHGPDGEFMQLMRAFVARLAVGATPLPVIPYFGSGENRLQPVSVLDAAHCFVASLSKPETVGRVFDLGGPTPYSWKQLYRTCKELIPGAWRFKPLVGVPVPIARLQAMTIMRLPLLVPALLRFNVGQVQMSQEDSVCDPRPVEQTFGIRMRDFRFELSQYADQIR